MIGVIGNIYCKILTIPLFFVCNFVVIRTTFYISPWRLERYFLIIIATLVDF